MVKLTSVYERTLYIIVNRVPQRLIWDTRPAFYEDGARLRRHPFKPRKDVAHVPSPDVSRRTRSLETREPRTGDDGKTTVSKMDCFRTSSKVVTGVILRSFKGNQRAQWSDLRTASPIFGARTRENDRSAVSTVPGSLFDSHGALEAVALFCLREDAAKVNPSEDTCREFPRHNSICKVPCSVT